MVAFEQSDASAKARQQRKPIGRASFGFVTLNWRWLALERGAGVDIEDFDYPQSVGLSFESYSDCATGRYGDVSSSLQHRNVEEDIADASL